MQIARADLIRNKDGMILYVTAIAPTLGWRNVSLSKVEYVVPPEDGLQDVVLSAMPPTGPAPTAIQMFELSQPLNIEAWFQGIRILNSSNESLIVLRNPTQNAASIGNDPFFMSGVGVKEDKLVIQVSYGGGCRNHTFQLNWDGIVMDSLTPKVRLNLSHNKQGDTCMALLSEQLQFDLSTLVGFPNQKVELIVQSPANSYLVLYDPPVTFGQSVEDVAAIGGVVGNG